MNWMRKKCHLPGLKARDGNINRTSGIYSAGKHWIFENNDPQIHLEFDKPVYSIRIVCNMKIDGLTEWIANLYYRRYNEDFSEANCCKLALVSGEKKKWEIRFDFPVFYIRFDPVDFSCRCEVDKLMIQPIGERDYIVDSLERKSVSAKSEKILVLTHDMSMTGAPLLAYHVAVGMKKKGVQVIVLTKKNGDGFLDSKYKKNRISVLNIAHHKENRIGYIDTLYNHMVSEEYPTFTEDTIHALREGGYKTVIANTVVSGEYIALFREYGFRIISLIHEMKTTIKFYGLMGYGNNIAKNADLIIFPNEYVMQDFNELFPQIYGKCIVQAQGIYMKNQEAEEFRTQCFEKYGIGEDDFVVMSSGTCELRKGIDLFVNAALILSSNEKANNIHYIWTGNFIDEELKCWLKSQIGKSGLDRYIHFIPFIKDTKEYSILLGRVNIFWALSREDPFPSTVLEAMKSSVPVVGFRGSGGIETMLSGDRGLLVEGFNLEKVVEITRSIYKQKINCSEIVKKAKEYVEAMDFEAYVQFLYECAFTDIWTNKEKDQYILTDRIHYFKRQLRENGLKDKEAVLDYAVKKKLFPLTKKVNIKQKIVLLDTAEGSDNIGDEIIMDYCGAICRNLLPDTFFYRIPTHIYNPEAEKLKDYLKILCGTNLIYTQMENSRQWVLPRDISSYRNICLMGVGMQQIGLDQPMSDYSKKLLRFVLSNRYLHSVRDEDTKKRLAEIGIKNVINTGCPTTWRLSKKHCAKIPCKKMEAVLTTITDYMPNPEKDKELLEMLRKHYNVVYIWIQGQEDYQYLQKLIDVKDYILIPPSLEKLDELFQSNDLDYVGTRLHAGIRSLNFAHRTVVISIDNRAICMARDINLPIIKRDELGDRLEEWIYGNQKTCINLPRENIELWKKQFK
ncbi:polysaccharide pyruvyl transferase family protein [Lachnospiraceae bacterium 56-18]|jgi:glycosyltransferase involved in cell wall biosynthesis